MQTVTGGTRLLAVAGSPVAHSLSPQIHNRFIRDLNLPFSYMAFDITPETLSAFASAAKLLNMGGFNLTMPLKEAVLPLLDEISEDAARCGAVNTVVIREGKLCGCNTDGDGFVVSLEGMGFRFQAQKALILGAGGAAKAIAVNLCRKGTRVLMASRRPAEISSLHENIGIIGWNEIETCSRQCSLLVNATPLGMHGVENDFPDFSFLRALEPGAVVYDLIYAPRETGLLARARETGLTAANGFSHLVCQAALSFCHFTGVAPARETVDDIIRSYMAGKEF